MKNSDSNDSPTPEDPNNYEFDDTLLELNIVGNKRQRVALVMAVDSYSRVILGTYIHPDIPANLDKKESK